MDPTPFLERVLDDEGLRADLDDQEGMLLVQSLIERIKQMANAGQCDAVRVEDLCRRARSVARTVAVTRDEGEAAGRAAAAASGLRWPSQAANLGQLVQEFMRQI